MVYLICSMSIDETSKRIEKRAKNTVSLSPSIGLQSFVQACAGYPTVTVSYICTAIPARLERPIGAEKMKIHSSSCLQLWDGSRAYAGTFTAPTARYKILIELISFFFFFTKTDQRLLGTSIQVIGFSICGISNKTYRCHTATYNLAQEPWPLPSSKCWRQRPLGHVVSLPDIAPSRTS